MGIVIHGNTEFFDPLPQEREPEDMNFQQEYDDRELRRTNPKRHDQRTDWTETNNEKGHDSDVSNRYSSTVKATSAVPASILLFKIEQLCERPTFSALVAVRRLLASASLDVRREVYERVLILQDAAEYAVCNQRIASTNSPIDLALRTYALKRIFA